MLDVAWNHDGSNLAFVQKASNKIFTASIGTEIYQNSASLIEVTVHYKKSYVELFFQHI